MSVEVISLQGGARRVTISATALFFTGVDNVALTPQTITPSGGIAPYSFASVNLPAGVTVGAATGVVSGTPTSSGNTSSTVTITDAAGHTLVLPVFFAIAVGSFADSFARADQPFLVGNQWLVAPIPAASNTVLGPNIAANINVAGNQLNFAICSSNGNNNLLCVPIPVSWDTIFSGHAQFAQAKISADNSGGANFAFCGPAAMFNVNKNTGYMIETNIIFGVGNSVGRYTVASNNGGAGQTAINNNGGAGFAFAIGDVLRIEAFPNTPAANQTTVKTFKNGVQQSSDVDAANHYDTGVYGLADWFVSAGVTQSWQNFAGGALT